MYLRYITDSTISSIGFKAQFTTVLSNCGYEPYRNITEDTEIWSPGAEKTPPQYPPNTRCMWIAETEPSKIMEFEFIFFELEQDDNCTKDKLIIYSGKRYSESHSFYFGINDTISSHIYCGTEKPHQ